MNVKTSSRHFPFSILNIKVPSAATPPGERPSILGNFVVRLEIYYEIHKTSQPSDHKVTPLRRGRGIYLKKVNG
jgi:hypothetical protein